jgi:DNA-binding YbaB/EbfC family protein
MPPADGRPHGRTFPSPSPTLAPRIAAVFDRLGQFAELMKNAGQIRESMEQAAASLGQVQVEGAAAGGAVTARVNGRMELLGVRIDPKLLADGDAELLEDLVTAAVNAALAKAREAVAETMSQGMPQLPPGLAKLFPS